MKELSDRVGGGHDASDGVDTVEGSSSLNESLRATNEKLARKVVELEQTNRELTNLRRDAGVPTVVLDRDLRVHHFLEGVAAPFHLRPRDVGQPISEVEGAVLGAGLAEESRRVLDTLEASAKEVADGGRWYQRRVGPWRRTDGEVGGVIVTFNEITSLKEAQEELAGFNDRLEEDAERRAAALERRARQLRRLASRMGEAEQAERRRIAMWVHGHLQQLLMAMKMTLSTEVDGEDGDTPVREALDLLETAIADARDLAREVYPPDLFSSGLVEALESLASEVDQRHGLRVELELETEAQPADESLRYLVYDAAKELLFNVVKHAGVQEATLRYRNAGEGSAVLEILDEGNGFEVHQLDDGSYGGSGMGLFSIQERIEAYGGSLEIASRPRGGTHVSLTAPLASDPEDGP